MFTRVLNTGPSPLRVLHLEDSPRDAALIRHQLKEGGLSCDVLLVDRKDCFEAALTQQPFDLILSDYDLPG
jgi:CheY-like chemotaxis protein